MLNPTCPPSEKDELPRWLEDLAHATLAIDCLFVLEIPAALYAFGLRYYGLSWRKPAVQRECGAGVADNQMRTCTCLMLLSFLGLLFWRRRSRAKSRSWLGCLLCCVCGELSRS